MNTIENRGSGLDRMQIATKTTLASPRGHYWSRGIRLNFSPSFLRLGFAGRLRYGLEAIIGSLWASDMVVGRVAYPDVFGGLTDGLIKFRRSA